MPKIITPRDHAHWLSLRSEDITSTEASALFNLSPYGTEFELFYEKVGKAENSFTMNERVLWGNRLEQAIAEGMGEDLGFNVRPFKDYYRHDTVDRMGSSFDYRIIMDNAEVGNGILEVKNVDSLVYRDKWTEDEAPPHIEIQLQHQLEVADLNWGIIAALVGGNQMKYIHRERNREMGENICYAVEEFWKSVDNNIPPEPDFEKDAEFIAVLYGMTGNDVVIQKHGDPEVLAELEAMHETNLELKDVELRKKRLKAEFLMKHGIVDGQGKGKILCDQFSYSYWPVSETPPTVITEDMVGDEIGGRRGFQGCRLSKLKGKG